MVTFVIFGQGVVFLDVISPEEYDPLVLNANRPAPLKVRASPRISCAHVPDIIIQFALNPIPKKNNS